MHLCRDIEIFEKIYGVNFSFSFTDDATFRQNALMWHNRLRCIHDADRVRLNDSLSKEAEEYAKEIVTKHNGILDHSKLESRKNEGENLAMTCSADKGITLKGAEATFKW